MLITPNHFPLLGMFVGVLFWVLDSLIDVFIFEESDDLYMSLFFPAPVELWMRSLVVCLLVMFALYLRKITNELLQYKGSVEYLVDKRTYEVIETNNQLCDEVETE